MAEFVDTVAWDIGDTPHATAQPGRGNDVQPIVESLDNLSHEPLVNISVRSFAGTSSHAELDIYDDVEDSSQLDVPVSDGVYDSLLQQAQLVNQRDSEQKLPWESGVFSSIFGDAMQHVPSASLPVPVPPSGVDTLIVATHESDRAPVEAANKRRIDDSFHSTTLRVKRDLDYHGSLERLWSIALNKWITILSCSQFAGPVGDRINQEIWSGCDGVETLRDVFGLKSPRTVNKRASMILALMDFSSSSTGSAWPLTAATVYDYLNRPESKKSATKGKTILESCRFAKFVVRMPDLDEILDDPFLSGHASRMQATMTGPKQARVLTLDEVKRMEIFMTEEHDLNDKYIMGCCLFALYSRSRWSDLSMLDDLDLDVCNTKDGPFGYVESSTRFQKTSNTATKRRLSMPLVAPIEGVTDVGWALIWFEVLDAVGFRYDMSPVGALCRPPAGEGFSQRSVTSTEIGDFINLVLGLEGSDVISSHSFKATTLAWSSKYGLSEPTRTLLGHHELGSKSLTCYSRDMLARPLAEYQSMLMNIKGGHFKPDLSRSGWMASKQGIDESAEKTRPSHAPVSECPSPSPFPEGAGQCDSALEFERGLNCEKESSLGSWSRVGEEPNSDAIPDAKDVYEDMDASFMYAPVNSSSSSSDDSSSESSSEASSCCEERLQNLHGSALPISEVPGPILQHRKSRVLHKPAKQDGFLACGRKRGAQYELLENGASLKWARCSNCFKGETLSSRNQMADMLQHLADVRGERKAKASHDT